MAPSLFAALTLLAESDPFRPLGVALLAAVLLGAAVLGSTDAGGSHHIHARNAKGGLVPPATTRDYVMITLFFAIAIAAIFVGLYFMNR